MKGESPMWSFIKKWFDNKGDPNLGQRFAGGVMWGVGGAVLALMLSLSSCGCVLAKKADPAPPPPAGAVADGDGSTAGAFPAGYPAAPPAVVVEAPAASWLYGVFLNDTVQRVLATLVGLLFSAVSLLFVKWKIGGARLKEALACIEAGVLDVYETYTRALKQAKESGGKLTVEEAAAAREKAWDRSVEIAREKGFDLLTRVARDRFGPVAEWILARIKRGEAPLA